MVASTPFHRPESLPRWLRVIAFLNPLTWHADVLRYTTIGLGSGDTTLAEAGEGGLAFLLLSFLLAVQTRQRDIAK